MNPIKLQCTDDDSFERNTSTKQHIDQKFIKMSMKGMSLQSFKKVFCCFDFRWVENVAKNTAALFVDWTAEPIRLISWNAFVEI